MVGEGGREGLTYHITAGAVKYILWLLQVGSRAGEKEGGQIRGKRGGKEKNEEGLRK